jgi:3-isopropylmalate/(R)-2-methylmalate dehydratase small subunit
VEAFSTHNGIVAPLDRDNVDTDAIIPKQFMKAIARTGFGPYVFDQWRFKDPGFFGKPAEERVPDPDFVLNHQRYSEASILLTRRNFGCGSSREHAPWALRQAGFRVLIAPSFADIFRNNCYKIGLLPVVLSDVEINELFRAVQSTPGYRVTVDLAAQTVMRFDGQSMHFGITPLRKERLMEGADEVGATLKHASDVAQFEADHLRNRPWL